MVEKNKAPRRAAKIESCLGRVYRSASVLLLTSLKSTQNRGLPCWITMTTGEAIELVERCTTSNWRSFWTASSINLRFLGEVRYGCCVLTDLASASISKSYFDIIFPSLPSGPAKIFKCFLSKDKHILLCFLVSLGLTSQSKS